MSKFFKSLLLLLSAGLFAATGWAQELVIPYSFDGKTGNTEVPFEYQVVMPNTALTSFTTTIRYAGGSHRVEILSVKLLDGETEEYTTAEATGTDGTVGGATGSYSGNNNYHNVYTFTNNAGFTASKVYTLQVNLKVTNNPPSHNGNIKVSGGITLDVQPFSFGVNFKTADAQNISTTTGAGFAKGDYAAPINWANYTADGGNHATYTVNSTAIDVSWGAYGRYDSGCSTDTDAGKLLHGYLDDDANDGRTKATVTISGLPENKKYAVALVLSGDGNGDADFNNRFSPVWINNEVYAYNNEATLVKGDAAKEIQYWGSRAASAAAAGLVEGTNVMFVEGLSGGAISITSAMDNQGVSRLTIAGVQVWVTDEAAEAPAAPEDKETISLNFYSSQGSVSGEAGLVAAGGWNNLDDKEGSASALNVWTGEKAVSYPMTLSYSSNNGYQWTTATDAFLKGYLDDGGNQADVTLTGIPFEEYSVIVYAATDESGRKFRSVTINGQAYIGTPGATTLGYALPVYNNTHARYGVSRALTAAYGTNALRVDGLSGDLNIVGGAKEFDARGGIAAIQIINTGTALPDAQVIDWTSQPAEQLKTSALPELTNVSVQLKLAEGATLEMDSDITGHTIEIVGNNVTVNVTNLEISQAAAQAIFPGATVTTAYTETLGIEVDGINHPYFFRGTKNATYNDAANWYIGKRVMGEQAKWLSVSGDKAPGMPNSAMWEHILLDGEMMDTISPEDGYKTITSTSNLEGWNARYTVINGAQLVISGLVKIQNGDGANAEWRVDETSKITFNGSLSTGHRVDFYVKSENGVTASNLTLNGSTNYELDSAGSVVVGALNGTATINGVELDLGDSNLSGRKVVPRKLIKFTSSDATFATAEGAVTTSVDTVMPEAVDILQNVGQYKFEKKDDGYYVYYVAYAEADEIGEVSTWTAKEDTTWATEGNWTFGVPTAGADAVISIAADTTITIPAEGVSVGTLLVSGEGTLTIAGGKITATKILAEANIAADENTLALAEMDIAEGKTVAYTTTTTVVANLDTFGNSHALALKALTGEGTLVKKGTGVIGLFNTKAEPAIVIEEGAIYVRDVPTTAMNIAAKAGTEIRLAAWNKNFNNSANSLKLEGGAQLTLANKENVSGTITIANATETAAKICGSSFAASTISATITGAGKVEFADGGTFGEGAYPCDQATTYSGVISGDLQVIISDTSAVTFTAANTYTGGTVIADGATVSVRNTNTIFGTGAITGAGTVKIAGGTYNGLSLAQYTDANTTIEIPADNTVSGYFNDATWTCAAKIQLDGTLSLINGYSNGRYTFTGPWAGAGSFSLSNDSPYDAVRITGDISDFTGGIAVTGKRAITFCAATTGNNQKYAGKICVHGDYAYTAKVNGTWSAPVVVENGAKIGGTGTIDNTITFKAGSIIDGAVTATGDVTLEGTVTVSGEAGATVLTCANAASLDLTKFAAPAGLKCIAEDGAVKLAVANPELFVDVAGSTTSLSAALGENELEANTILKINFGDGTTPGRFTFDNDAEVSFAKIIVTGTNGGTIEKTGAGAVSVTTFTREASCSNLTLDVTLFSSFYDGNQAIEIDGWTLGLYVPAGETEQLSDVFTVNSGATLKKVGEGELTLSGANNFRGTLDVKNGTLSANGLTNGAVANNNGFSGMITIAKGATLTILGDNTSDSLAYGQTVVVDVAGTLNLNTHRWTLGANTTLQLRPGAEVTGTGQTHEETLYGALDWNGKATIHVMPAEDSITGTATITANMRFRSDSLFNIEEGMTLEVSGDILQNSAGKTLEKSGRGTLVYNVSTTPQNPHSVSVNEGTIAGYGSIGDTLTLNNGATVAAPTVEEQVLTVTDTVTVNGTATMTGNFKVAGLGGSGTLVAAQNATATLECTGTSTFAGSLNGVNLVVADGASMTLSGTAPSTLTTIAGTGTLELNCEGNGQTKTVTLTSSSIFGGTLALTGQSTVNLYLNGLETLTFDYGAKVLLSCGGGSIRASARERLVFKTGASIVKPTVGVQCIVQFEGGAIIDVTDGNSLSVAADVIFPEGDDKVIVKVDSLGTFLRWSNPDPSPGNVSIPLASANCTIGNELPYALQGAMLCSAEDTNENFIFGLVKVDTKGVELVPEDLATLTQNAYVATGGEMSDALLEFTKIDVLQCFDDVFTVDFDWDAFEETGAYGYAVSCYFGIGNVTVLPRMEEVEGEPVQVQKVAVAVKVEDGNGNAAGLRDGTEIHLSKDGGVSYEETALTPLDDDELETAGLLNGEGVYWYWAEALSEIDSTTRKYKVKAVNNGATPAQQ